MTETPTNEHQLAPIIVWYRQKPGCPACGSFRSRITSSRPPKRYHKCLDCGQNFPSIEKSDSLNKPRA